jgi:hypothetical protein
MDRGRKSIPGESYSVSLSTRYYGTRLLYILEIEPYDDNARRFASTVSIELTDSKGFILGSIPSSSNWINIVDDSGKRVSLSSQGSIAFTLRNYLEIVSWGPNWTSRN